MSAIAWYVGERRWTDAPECVCPVIRGLCIQVNDILPTDDDRERVIGPVMFRVIGTRGSPELELERRRVLVRWACAKARSVLHLVRAGDERPRRAIEAAETWAQSPSAAAAAATVGAAADAYAAASAASAAAANAANAANAAANAVLRTGAIERAEDMIALILQLAAIGERTEMPQVRDLAELPGWSGAALEAKEA